MCNMRIFLCTHELEHVPTNCISCYVYSVLLIIVINYNNIVFRITYITHHMYTFVCVLHVYVYMYMCCCFNKVNLL